MTRSNGPKEPPKPTIESLQELIEKERKDHERELGRLRANHHLEATSRIQWQERATVAEAQLKAIREILGLQ